ncbi:hypothetical protein ISM_03175 [Roseovarius nubinhibens ISM]|uniref:Uncharacterized protein n=1 Tax=Roseovarius nubinhibens (strain ATCC BAA-591 / DSM 15170 / ISM) TaxID=89187 RepID=A3SIS7_ROSNI|nr:hypothetical protein ISM_03175 [Roseovarius nubinhibens ISM]
MCNGEANDELFLAGLVVAPRQATLQPGSLGVSKAANRMFAAFSNRIGERLFSFAAGCRCAFNVNGLDTVADTAGQLVHAVADSGNACNTKAHDGCGQHDPVNSHGTVFVFHESIDEFGH